MELANYDVAGIDGGDEVVLVEGGIGCHQVALLDVGYMLYAFNEDTMFLHPFDPLLDGTVHFGIERARHLVAAGVLYGNELCVVIDGGLPQLGPAGFKALVAVPPHIVVACGVVVLDVCPPRLLGRAGCH